jgi:hypothetical protein
MRDNWDKIRMIMGSRQEDMSLVIKLLECQERAYAAAAAEFDAGADI